MKKNIGFILLGCITLIQNISANEFDAITLDEHLLLNEYTKLEGHIRAVETTQPDVMIKLVENNSEIKLIGEIGFNAGHSSLLFLESNQHAKVVSFDNMAHEYVLCAKEYIDAKAPGRHILIEGNSVESVPAFAEQNPSSKFDLIFIDGGHRDNVPLLDIINMRALSHKDTILVIDDINHSFVGLAYEKCIEDKIIARGKVYRSGRKNWVVCRYLFD